MGRGEDVVLPYGCILLPPEISCCARVALFLALELGLFGWAAVKPAVCKPSPNASYEYLQAKKNERSLGIILDGSFSLKVQGAPQSLS